MNYTTTQVNRTTWRKLEKGLIEQLFLEGFSMDVQIREEEKDKYIEFLLRQYRLVDAFTLLRALESGERVLPAKSGPLIESSTSVFKIGCSPRPSSSRPP